MKKFISVLLAIVMLAGLAVPAFAVTNFEYPVNPNNQFFGKLVLHEESGNTFTQPFDVSSLTQEQTDFLKDWVSVFYGQKSSSDSYVLAFDNSTNRLLFYRVLGGVVFSQPFYNFIPIGAYSECMIFKYNSVKLQYEFLLFNKVTPTTLGQISNSVVYYKNADLSNNSALNTITYPGTLYFSSNNPDIFPLPTTSHNLTINYQHADGTKAADSVTRPFDAGAAYSVQSPVIAGYAPDKPVVSGTMPDSDTTVTVTYSPAPYNLTVNYQYKGGAKAADSVVKAVPYLSPYSVESPVIAGYAPDKPIVSGTMPKENVTVTVTYESDIVLPVLTVHYQYVDGTKAADSTVAEYVATAPYSITPPVIDGYTPDRDVLTGRMPETDLTLTVVYTKKPDTGGGTGGDPGGGSGYDPFQKPPLIDYGGYDPFKRPTLENPPNYDPFQKPSGNDYSGYDPFKRPSTETVPDSDPFKKPSADSYSGYDPFKKQGGS